MNLKYLILLLPLFASDLLHAGSHHGLIPKEKREHTRRYQTLNYPAPLTNGNTFLHGIRRVKHHHKKFLIAGYYVTPDGLTTVPFVYRGRLTGKGEWHPLHYPTSINKTVTSTQLYGPNQQRKEIIEVVGSYTTAETGSRTMGCLYEGHLNGSGQWKTLVPHTSDTVLNTVANSTMGGIVVGTYNTELVLKKAFIYDIKHGIYHHIHKHDTVSITAHGVWHNGRHSYTICGTYSTGLTNTPAYVGYLVDWNSESHEFSNWRHYSFDNDPANVLITRFNGITSDEHGGYYLTGTWSPTLVGAERTFFAHIKKHHNHKAKWSHIVLPGQLLTEGRSVYKRNVIGVYTSPVTNSINGFVSIPD